MSRRPTSRHRPPGRTPRPCARSRASWRSCPRCAGCSAACGCCSWSPLCALPALLDERYTNLAAAVVIYSIIAISLVMLTGWAGEISLGQVAFVAIGSACAGAANVHWHLGPVLSFLLAGVVGAVASVDHRHPRLAHPRPVPVGDHTRLCGRDVVVPARPRLLPVPARRAHRPRPPSPGVDAVRRARDRHRAPLLLRRGRRPDPRVAGGAGTAALAGRARHRRHP